MDYSAALEYIHSVSNFFCKPGLERISRLCDMMGNPQKNLKFIHVAGTNGKGSFCAMLSKILSKNGYKTGLYISPYILNFNERISIDSTEISNDDLATLTEYVKKFADNMEDKPTEFELITAIAFEYFKRQKCDVVVLECGLGGRFDATNIIDNSILSVITGISIDHTSFLGDTIESIASEKAGIIKEKGLILWCGTDEIAQKIIYNKALEKDATFYNIKEKSASNINYSLDGTTFDYKDYKNIKLSLLGKYQVNNAVNVLNAVEMLKSKNFSITDESVRLGLESTVWHARFEIIFNEPMIIFDGGHNIEGVNTAIESINEYFKNKKLNVISGVMKDKDYEIIAERIGSICEMVYCVTPNNDRALPSEEYKKVFLEKGIAAKSFEDINNALSEAIKDSLSKNIPIIILGSLYMYCQILSSLNKIF